MPLTVLDADSVVNAPVEAVVAPIDILLIVPGVPELIVMVPAPVVVYD